MRRYALYDPPLLQAPNVIYLPYNGKDNQLRYELTDYTGSGDIPIWGAPSSGMTTTVSFTPTVSVSTITWNYKKQVRVTVSTSGEDVPLKTYDTKGDTKAGSDVVTLESTAGLTPGMMVYGNGILSGTTITAVDETSNAVTLSKPAAHDHGTELPRRGRAAYFCPRPRVDIRRSRGNAPAQIQLRAQAMPARQDPAFTTMMFPTPHRSPCTALQLFTEARQHTVADPGYC